MRLETKKLDKDEFYHRLSERSGFTLGDTKLFWHSIEDLFLEAIQSRIGLDLRGFGELFYSTIAERTMKNPQTKETVVNPEVTRIVFRLGQNYRDVLKVGYRKFKK